MAVAVAVAEEHARAVLVLAVAEAPSNVLVPSRQGPDGMPQRVVGSRASPSVLCWAPWLDALLANSTGASLALMAEAMAPGLEHPNGQAAQASSPSSWGGRHPQGSPAESSSSAATARTPSNLQMIQPTMVVVEVA